MELHKKWAWPHRKRGELPNRYHNSLVMVQHLVLKVQKDLRVILEPVTLLEKVKWVIHLHVALPEMLDPKKRLDAMMILGHRYIVHTCTCIGYITR
jgi:hypothetical protein